MVQGPYQWWCTRTRDGAPVPVPMALYPYTRVPTPMALYPYPHAVQPRRASQWPLGVHQASSDLHEPWEFLPFLDIPEETREDPRRTREDS